MQDIHIQGEYYHQTYDWWASCVHRQS